MYIKNSYVLIVKLKPDKFLRSSNVNSSSSSILSCSKWPKRNFIRESSSSTTKNSINWIAHENDPNSVLFKKTSKILKFKNDGNFYHEKVVLGYSRQQMCDLVFDVSKYHEFVPFCINSEVIKESINTSKVNNRFSLAKTGFNLRTMDQPLKKAVENAPKTNDSENTTQSFRAKLEIGYPPIREAYISNVSMVRPHLVKAISKDTRLFEFLINEWKFHPYDAKAVEANKENSCIIEFYVSFKFRSVIYTRFANLFMDQVFKKMVMAFTNRAAKKYGKASMEPQLLTKHHE